MFAVRRYKKAHIHSSNSKKQHLSFEYRNLKSLDNQKFVKDLSEAPWDTAFVFDETDDIVDSWYGIFNSILDKHTPVMSKRVKRARQPK